MLVGLLITAGLVVMEGLTQWFVRKNRRRYPWLITQADELPEFDPNRVSRFFEASFDEDCGWIRKPNSSGTEQGKDGPVTFTIDSSGSRVIHNDRPATIATFGDSFAFCRQVGDGETWESALGREMCTGVLNYGVGNYGLDQAMLRYEKTQLPDTVETVVMAVVPETICRVQSYWKHYLEFGNIMAFKPRFVQENGRLALKRSPISGEADFANLAQWVGTLQPFDRFYKGKFKKYQFRFPFVFSFLRAPLRNVRLFGLITLAAAMQAMGRQTTDIDDRVFRVIMIDNIKASHLLYLDEASVSLLKCLFERFSTSARRRGHRAMIVFLPQLADLMQRRTAVHYQNFLRRASRDFQVVDLTDALAGRPLHDLYVNDKYGGHLSAHANEMVGKVLAMHLRRTPPGAPNAQT